MMRKGNQLITACGTLEIVSGLFFCFEGNIFMTSIFIVTPFLGHQRNRLYLFDVFGNCTVSIKFTNG